MRQDKNFETASKLAAGRLVTNRSYALALLVFLVGGAIYAWPWLSGEFTLPWDAKAQAWPQLAFLNWSLHAGESPFWTPNVYAGWPQIADPQSLIFSPPFLLLAWLHPALDFRAMDAVVFGMLALGGVSMLALFKDRGWHAAGALVAAFAFAYGGSASWRIQHVGEVLSLCWFIIALWLLERALVRRSVAYGAAAGLIAGFMVLGRDQIALLCVAILAFAVVWHVFSGPNLVQRVRGFLPPLTAGLVVGVVTIALPLALTFALAQQSNRPEIDFDAAGRGSLAAASYLTAFVANLFGTDGPLALFWGPPNAQVWGANDIALARNMSDIYFGAIPLVAILSLGLARAQVLRRDVLVFAVSALLMALYALGRNTPLFTWAFHIPGVDLYRRPADATFPLGAMLAIVAGYCVHRAIETRARLFSLSHSLGLLLVVAGWSLCVYVAWSHGRLDQAGEPLLAGLLFLASAYCVLAFSARFQHTAPYLVLILLGGVLTLDLRLNNRPNESTALSPDVYDVLRFDTHNETLAFLKDRLRVQRPDHRDRVELAAIDFHWPNVSLVHNLDHNLGYNPLRLKLFADVTHAQDHVATAEQRNFSPLFPSYNSNMANLFGLTYIVTGVPITTLDPTIDTQIFKQVARTPDAYVYENPNAFPRVYFAAGSKSARFDEMIETGVWPDVDLTKTILLENAPDVEAPVDVRSDARLVSYGNTEVVVDVTSDQDGWLVLNDIWHPWWNVEVDEAPAVIQRANVMFRAVAVTKGSHRLRFHFDPVRGMVKQFWH